MRYIDITDQYTSQKKYQIKKQKFFLGDDGTRYYNAKNRTWVNTIVLVKDKIVLKVFKRK